MPHGLTRRTRPGDKYRGHGSHTVKSTDELKDELAPAPDPVIERLRTIKRQDEVIAHDNTKSLEVIGLTRALGPMAERQDHRRRPRIVSPKTFRFYRTNKLRPPDKLKKKRKK